MRELYKPVNHGDTLSPSSIRELLVISQTGRSLVMQKHMLLELSKIISERIGSLMEELEIATNVNLNSLYLADLKDEIISLQWSTRMLNRILDRAIDGHQPLGITKKQLESEDIEKFENVLYERIQVLEIELHDSNTAKEKEVLVNEINTLKCVLGHLYNLKSGGNRVQATWVAEANISPIWISAQLQNRVRVKDTFIHSIKPIG